MRFRFSADLATFGRTEDGMRRLADWDLMPDSWLRVWPTLDLAPPLMPDDPHRVARRRSHTQSIEYGPAWFDGRTHADLRGHRVWPEWGATRK